MGVDMNNSLGKLYYSDEFLADLAGLCAMECYGIVGMSSKRAVDGIIELVKGENLKKGVRITTNDKKVKIDLYVIVEYGVSISAVAKNVIDTVKYNVEKGTGLIVTGVNVIVDGIRI
jgi:uncharacterized alkaline shock family protein YloU